MDHPNGGAAQGRLERIIEEHTEDIKEMKVDIGLLKRDSSSVQALFHRIDERAELEYANLKWSLWEHKSGLAKDIVFMVGTAIIVVAYVSAHMPK